MSEISEIVSAATPEQGPGAEDGVSKDECGQNQPERKKKAKSLSNDAVNLDLYADDPQVRKLEGGDFSAEPIDQFGVILRAHREVAIQHVSVDGMDYVTGKFSDLHFGVMDCLARAIGSMLPVALAIEKSDLQWRTGHLFDKDRLCAASQFLVGERQRLLIDDEALIRAIAQCVDLLKDAHLWDYKRPTEEEAEEEPWALVEAARRGRGEISAKQLPFAASVSSTKTALTLQIDPALAPSKPGLITEESAQDWGSLCGYCTTRRHVSFMAERAHSVIDISFDVEKFFDDVYQFSGKKRHKTRLKWTEVSVDGVVSQRTLESIESLMESLF